MKEYIGILITGYTAGVLQRARTIFGLIYGTRAPARQCQGMSAMGTPQRLETEEPCRDGLIRSSDDTTVMEEERRNQVIQSNNIKQDRKSVV